MAKSYTRRRHGGGLFTKTATNVAAGAAAAPEQPAGTTNGLVPMKLTNLLKVFAGTDTLQYNPAKGTLDTLLEPTVFYDYEAFLTRCAYFARLAYAPSDMFMRALPFTKHGPADMNDIITVLDNQLRRYRSFRDLFITPGSEAAGATTEVGAFFPLSGCSIIKYGAGNSKVFQKDIVYVCFKGSSSLKDFRRDLNVSKIALKDIPELASAPGTVHKGFYNHLRVEIADILKVVAKLAGDDSVDRVVVLGHSLGGAMASLCSLMVAHGKTVEKPVHCVTFGAPMLFSDDARNYFNGFLDSGVLTLDRVTANLDPITSVPKPSFNHPGYTLLKTELYPTKKTGRAYDIKDIRRVCLGEAASQVAYVPTDKPEYMEFFEALPFTRTGKATTDQGLLDYVLPDLRIKVDPGLEAAEDEKESKEEAAIAQNAPATNEQAPAAPTVQPTQAALAEQAVQAGGFSLTASAKAYDDAAKTHHPNRILYAARGFAHGNYMNIGFMACLRFPSVAYRDSTGKIQFMQAKKEPTERTVFKVGANGRYVATVCGTAQAGGKRWRWRSSSGSTRRNRKRSVRR
jgi:hypothetical protein